MHTFAFYRDILDYSPAEISVIDMSPGKNRFDVLYVNRTKLENFAVSGDAAVGQKCHRIFESLRPANKAGVGCGSNCPALEAYEKNGQEIHRDWQYLHPISKQIRIVNITARRIPGTHHVIEVCRDNTMRRRISEMTSLLSRVESYQQIEEIIHTGFLTWLYFDRCRFYRLSNSSLELVLKSFKKGIPKVDQPCERNMIDVTAEVVLTRENSEADKALLENNDTTPKLFYISDLVRREQTPECRFQKAIRLSQCHSTQQLEKQRYPIWLDLPISASGKIIGKISVDIAQGSESARWTVADYEIESLELLAQTIGQAWENVRLLDVDELRKIDTIVWVNKGVDLRGVLSQIMNSTCSYLGFDHSHIALDRGNHTVEIIDREFDTAGKARVLPFAESFCGNVIEKYNRDQDETPSIFDPIPDELRQTYKDIGDQDLCAVREAKSCLATPMIDDDGVLVGAWYLESAKTQMFNEYLTDRIQVIARQMAGAVRRVQADKELEKKRDQALKSQTEAEKNLEEKERFYQTAQHEMLAPIDPIAATFKLFKRKVESLNIKDRRLVQLADEGITHCQFLRYTFDNLDFLRSEPIFLNYSEAQIFKEVIIPVVETVREFAKEQGVQIEYSGYQIVEKYISLDVNRMRNVFFNLLRNAIKYSHRGTVIYVRGVKVTEGNSLIEVENRGIGVPEGMEEQIFHLYRRADNARKLTTPGSGIGLYISRKIIKSHSGKLYLAHNHEPTIFSLELPKNGGRRA
jgi:signal transduction histidine kinase